jgi:hypothetical protein
MRDIMYILLINKKGTCTSMKLTEMWMTPYLMMSLLINNITTINNTMAHLSQRTP